MRHFTAPSPETGKNPLGTCHHIRSSHPYCKEHHYKYLIPHGPQPRKPYTLQSVYKKDGDSPHCSGDVEHAGSVGESQKVPFYLFAAEEIGIYVFRCFFRKDETERENNCNVYSDY
ncbi:hypothetical protein SDC9_159091 [bioreactor metagenome]|uniref:Uncharacterized protein n=1 Tax=bioreactor metagenome TaxID=1076179 RepID=A0A645FHQ7_9ZZZZ